MKSNMRENGYYWVKFYNHNEPIIMLWNGKHFKCFATQQINDEIESVNENRITYRENPPLKLDKQELDYLEESINEEIQLVKYLHLDGCDFYKKSSYRKLYLFLISEQAKSNP